MFIKTCFDCLRHLFISLLYSTHLPPSFFFPFLCPLSYLFFLFILRTSSYFIIILRHFYNLYEAAVAIKISNFLICFCSFDLSFPIVEKENVIENLYIVLFYLIK